MERIAEFLSEACSPSSFFQDENCLQSLSEFTNPAIIKTCVAGESFDKPPTPGESLLSTLSPNSAKISKRKRRKKPSFLCQESGCTKKYASYTSLQNHTRKIHDKQFPLVNFSFSTMNLQIDELFPFFQLNKDISPLMSNSSSSFSAEIENILETEYTYLSLENSTLSLESENHRLKTLLEQEISRNLKLEETISQLNTEKQNNLIEFNFKKENFCKEYNSCISTINSLKNFCTQQHLKSVSEREEIKSLISAISDECKSKIYRINEELENKNLFYDQLEAEKEKIEKEKEHLSLDNDNLQHQINLLENELAKANSVILKKEEEGDTLKHTLKQLLHL